MNDRPKLSVVVATVRSWPGPQMTVDSLYDQARAVGAEIIIGMREGCLPDASYPEAVRIVEPHGTLLSLRAAAFRRARGRVIAMTEDHCRVRPDWCEAVLRAHANHPDAPVIIGCVENTARDRWSEWGTYLLGNGAFMAPLQCVPYSGSVTSANVSFKSQEMPKEFPQRGWTGDWHADWLRQRGAASMLDPTSTVDHELSLSLREAFRAFYRSARASTPERSEGDITRMLFGALWRIACSPVNAVRTALRVAVHKGRFRTEAISSIPTVAILIIAHNLGVARGAIGGPGSAPYLLR